MAVGILALQGAFQKHREALQILGAPSQLVRSAKDLLSCTSLIIPGGESTTMLHHLSDPDFRSSLQAFIQSKPVFGTCAGMILLAKRIQGGNESPFGAMDITVQRNAYGRQIDSFETPIALWNQEVINGCFIRAPKVVAWDAQVDILAHHGEDPVLLRQGNLLACSFHPELTDSLSIHRYFLEM